MKLFFRTLAFCCVLLLLSGCNGAKKSPDILPQAVPGQEYHDVAAMREKNPGSLFNEAEADQLFADGRARRVGDLVVVKIVEQTKADTKANTTAQKGNSNNYGIGTFFGQPQVAFVPIVGANLPGVKSAQTDPSRKIFALDTVSTSNLNATGETKRENYVTTSMATRVIRVLPGGLMQIEGARETRVNEETEYMVLTGVIRTKDVSADNSVLSTQVADASISYYGKGVLGDKQKAGWFTRLMDNIWPF
ncbi:MAG: flagellar basal body L-ring protein FlgH [Deltaproteobacteria bacterium]|jgi:flagellar L-ring protein precursor FlgH|nr:flagellar basal body L-ring protein FlgH [Deltaproteobacteria bacterium]